MNKVVVFSIPYDEDGQMAEYPEVITTDGSCTDSVALRDSLRIKVFDDIEEAKAAARAICAPSKGDGHPFLHYAACEYVVMALPGNTNFSNVTALELWNAGEKEFSVKKS